jgi:hypothetical protein
MLYFFERVARTLFGAAPVAAEAEEALIDETLEAFIEAVEPRVRLRSGYREKLSPQMRGAVAYLRGLARERLDPRLLSRAAWSEDPHVRAFFAAAEDVPATLDRSVELREFFEEHPACDEAHALLGMRYEERQVFAPRLEGEVLRHDVAQTTIGFSGHRLIASAGDEAGARREVGRRILQRLAQLALARIVALGEQGEELQQRKACLSMRLRMLERARDGLQPLMDGGIPLEQQMREVRRALKEASRGYAEARVSLASLDGYIDQMNAVLAHPEAHVALARRRVLVSRLGVLVDPGSSEPADELDLAELSIGDGLQAVVTFVRVPRAELPPREDLLVRAARAL